MFFWKNKTKQIVTALFLVVLIITPLFFVGNVAMSAFSAGGAKDTMNKGTGTATTGGDSKAGPIDKAIAWFKGGAERIGMAVVTAPLIIIRKGTAVFFTAAMDTMDLMLSDALYSGVFFSPEARTALNTGWSLVRDFVNMFYVLILIFLAIATILRVNKFSDKKLLLSVVISALLVNFSKPIALFIIDASNLAMSFFMGNITATGLSYTELLAEKINFSTLWAGNMGKDMDGMLVIMISEIIFTLIFAITLFFLAIALLIRMIAFWVLIVLSPLAFFGLALPGTFMSSLFKNWLEKMVHWAFFGPVLLFFLWLALVLVNALTIAKTNAPIPGLNQTPIASGQGLSGFVINFFRHIIPYAATIYLLFYGFDTSRKLAEKAGSSVGGIMKKGNQWMNKGLKYSAVAGTGAVGLAGAYGYGVGRDRATVAKQKLDGYSGDSRWGKTASTLSKASTKKGRAKIGEDRRAKYTDSEGVERTKTNESYKKMKDSGQTKDEVISNLNSKSKYTSAGAAKLAAEKGWLGKQDNFKVHEYENYDAAAKAAGNVKPMKAQFDDLAKKKNLDSVITHDLNTKARELGHADASALAGADPTATAAVLDKYMKNKGAVDFADEGKEFFDNNIISRRLNDKYAAASPEVKEAAKKKATDKINDPEKLQKVMEIIDPYIAAP